MNVAAEPVWRAYTRLCNECVQKKYVALKSQTMTQRSHTFCCRRYESYYNFPPTPEACEACLPLDLFNRVRFLVIAYASCIDQTF